MGTCEEIIIRLRNIENYINQLLATSNAHYKAAYDPTTFRGQNSQGWTYNQTGKTWFFEQTVTFTGATQNINLDFIKAGNLIMIEQVFNDATARDFSIKKSSSETITQFTQLSTQVGNVALSELDYDLGRVGGGGRLQFAYSITTLGKIVVIRVTVQEIV